MIQKIIRLLDRLDTILDKNKAFGCPNCGNYRLKFKDQWECPQSGRWCGIYDRLAKKKLKEGGFREWF